MEIMVSMIKYKSMDGVPTWIMNFSLKIHNNHETGNKFW
jgi:hypothetical protein